MNKKIYFTGGGTGGHVFPGIAVIEKLIENYDIKIEDIVWIGSGKGIEKQIISRFDIKYYSIPSGKLRRYFSFRNALDIFKVKAGFIKIFFKFIFDRPQVLFSKGGYVTVPPVIAAKILRIPVITHESDIVPGLATRINSRFVDKILLPYQVTKEKHFQKYYNKSIVTGNPVRKEIFSANKDDAYNFYDLDRDKKVILVSGGSQGASEINNIIYENIDYLTENFNVIHQTGSNFTHIDKKGYFYKEFFNEEFASFLKLADIVISRAGAGTVWENGVTGTPSILIPLGYEGSRGDQVLNAQYFEKVDACRIYKNDLKEIIEDILSNSSTISTNSKKLCNDDATNKIAEIIYEYIK